MDWGTYTHAQEGVEEKRHSQALEQIPTYYVMIDFINETQCLPARQATYTGVPKMRVWHTDFTCLPDGPEATKDRTKYNPGKKFLDS